MSQRPEDSLSPETLSIIRNQIIEVCSDTLVDDFRSLRPVEWPRWMTTPTCAAYIDRTIQGVQGLLKRGRIPFVKQGGRVYFDRFVIDDWMATAGQPKRRGRRSRR